MMPGSYYFLAQHRIGHWLVDDIASSQGRGVHRSAEWKMLGHNDGLKPDIQTGAFYCMIRGRNQNVCETPTFLAKILVHRLQNPDIRRWNKRCRCKCGD